MGLYTALDGKSVADVATNSGWRDFCAWVAEIDGVADLRHLTEYGWYEGDLGQVELQLQAAVEDAGPTPDQASIAQGLLAVLAARGSATVLVVSDGTGEGEGEEIIEAIHERLARAAGIVWQDYP